MGDQVLNIQSGGLRMSMYLDGVVVFDGPSPGAFSRTLAGGWIGSGVAGT